MVGLIEQVNWNMWMEILLTASNLASRMVLYTIYTRKEAELIARSLDEAGWDVSIIDNRDASGIYDQWAVQADRKG
jgi:predicted methyltransferase MtxX (methanogen marker protein 4)